MPGPAHRNGPPVRPVIISYQSFPLWIVCLIFVLQLAFVASWCQRVELRCSRATGMCEADDLQVWGRTHLRFIPLGDVCGITTLPGAKAGVRLALTACAQSRQKEVILLSDASLHTDERPMMEDVRSFLESPETSELDTGAGSPWPPRFMFFVFAALFLPWIAINERVKLVFSRSEGRIIVETTRFLLRTWRQDVEWASVLGVELEQGTTGKKRFRVAFRLADVRVPLGESYALSKTQGEDLVREITEALRRSS